MQKKRDTSIAINWQSKNKKAYIQSSNLKPELLQHKLKEDPLKCGYDIKHSPCLLCDNEDERSEKNGKHTLPKINKEEELRLKKTIEDVPPEVLTIIIKHLIQNETRNTILAYRLVNSKWKEITDYLIERHLKNGSLKHFPTMWIKLDKHHSTDGLYVCNSSISLDAQENPFPFNSLFLCEGQNIESNIHFHNNYNDIQKMTINCFKLKYASNLTTLSLKDVIFNKERSLLTLLEGMTCLKTLRLQNTVFNDKIITPNLNLGIEPKMPNLDTLEVLHDTLTENVSHFTYSSNDDTIGCFPQTRYILYVWLIAVLSKQLVYLKINTREHLPALTKSVTYYYNSCEDDTKVYIASTSENAFEKLVVLEINCSLEFVLRDSEFPNIQNLSVNGPPVILLDNNQHLINFINKCRSTLVQLHLDIGWCCLIEPCLVDYGSLSEPQLLFTSPFPKLKFLGIRFCPANDRSQETIVKNFLQILPALETLHLLRFPESCITKDEELNQNEHSNETYINIKHEIAKAEKEFFTLQQIMYKNTRKYFQQRKAVLTNDKDQDEQLISNQQLAMLLQVASWEAQLFEFENNMNAQVLTFHAKESAIFKRLAALGVKKQVIIINNFLRREDIWNVCPHLKLIIVSTMETSIKNICIIGRPGDQ